MKLCLGRGLEAKRQAGGDQNDRFASLRQRLVEQTLRVAECTGKGIVGHDPTADLVRDEDHRSFKATDGCCQVLSFARRIEAAQKKLAEPKRHAINHDDAIGAGLPPEGLGQRDRFFHKRPARIPCASMAGYARNHLSVTRLRCRDQDRMAPGGFREPLRIAAFARPCAAKDKQAFRQVRQGCAGKSLTPTGATPASATA